MALARALGQMRRHLWLQTVAISSLTVALAMVGMYLALSINAHQSWDRLATGAKVVAALSPQAGPQEGRELARRLAAEPQVAAVAYVGAEQALARFREQLGPRQGLLEGLTTNPLPATVELTLKPGAPAGALLAKLKTEHLVEEVATTRPWLQGLERAGAVLGELAAALGLLLFLGVVFISANLVRLAVHTRRRELEIMDLVGASRGFMRRPFLVEAALQALMAAAAASLLDWGLLAFLRQPVALPLGVDLARLLAFPPVVPVVLAGLALLAAVLGGWLGVGRALNAEEKP